MSTIRLKRILQLPEVVFIAIGFTIGGGVFVFTGIVLKITGPALPLAYGLAVIPVFISMMPLAMLGSAIPSTGGNYKYPSRMVSPGLAFVGIWVYALASFFGQIPLYAISCAKYVQFFLPDVSSKLLAIGLLTFFFLINLFGVRPAAQVQGAMVITLISALILYSGKGFPEIDMNNFENFFQKGTGNLILGIALLTFTYLGSNGIIELGGEIKNPGRVIPRAFFIAFPVVTIIYLLVSVVTVGAVSWQNLIGVDEPLVDVSKAFLGKAGVIFFITGGAILALTTTINALFIVGTKSLLMIINDKILPTKLGKINRQFNTPHLLLTIIWIFSIAGVLSGFSLETFASYAVLGGIIIFLPVLIASLLLPKRYPDKYERSSFRLRGFWLWFCPFTGFLMMLFFSAVILNELYSLLKIGFFLIFIFSGVLYYKLRKRYLLKHGIDLKDIKKKEDWTE